MLNLECKAVCIEVHKKSVSPAFKNLKVGDVIKFSTPLCEAETEKEVREMETKMKHIITTQSLLCKNYLEARIKY